MIKMVSNRIENTEYNNPLMPRLIEVKKKKKEKLNDFQL